MIKNQKQRRAMFAKLNGKIVIYGNDQYTERMYKHLIKEHPSTKNKMIRVKSNPISAKERIAILRKRTRVWY